MRTKRPEVTVLMPVYNAEGYLDEAIQSVLNQTFTDFEFLIINDGSTDSSTSAIRKYHDKRIRFINNKIHHGLVSVLNQGLSLARGNYLARMDADDISLPCRLQQQVSFMKVHPEIGICGTWFAVFESNGRKRVYTRPLRPAACKAALLFTDPVCHASAIFRMGIFRHYKFKYDPDFRHLEDYELFNRIAEKVDFANLKEVLYLYRYHEQSTGHMYNTQQRKLMKEVQGLYLRKLGIFPNRENLDIHWQIMSRTYEPSPRFLYIANRWLRQLIAANRKFKAYDSYEFRRVIAKRWDYVCRDCLVVNWQMVKQYWWFYGELQLWPGIEGIMFSLRPIFPWLEKALYLKNVLVRRVTILRNNVAIKLCGF